MKFLVFFSKTPPLKFRWVSYQIIILVVVNWYSNTNHTSAVEKKSEVWIGKTAEFIVYTVGSKNGKIVQ